MTRPSPVEQILNAAFALDEAVDAKDWARVRRSFAARVGVRIGVLVGESAATLPKDELVAGITALNPPTKLSCHMLFNPIVVVTGDRATLRAKRHGWARCDHLMPPLHELWGLVSYGFILSGGRWLIDDMGLVTLREAGNQEVAQLRDNG